MISSFVTFSLLLLALLLILFLADALVHLENVARQRLSGLLGTPVLDVSDNLGVEAHNLTGWQIKRTGQVCEDTKKPPPAVTCGGPV